jgi:hypothetical protein
MKDLTYLQKRILEKLLPELGKTEPYEELLRLSLLYRQIKDIKKDNFLFEKFKGIINNSLYFHLKSKEEFYDLDRFKDIYKILVEEFIEDNIDANENDFIDSYINSQQEIINKTIEYFIPVSGYESLELIQFVQKDFLDEFIIGSKKKIEFLENRLYVLNTSISEVNEVNPYPLIFISADIYLKFIEYASNNIIDYYLDYSYLKKRLENLNLIHSIKDNEFMRILYEEMGLISKKDYEEYSIKNKLSSLNKSSSTNRENNFNNIFD